MSIKKNVISALAALCGLAIGAQSQAAIVGGTVNASYSFPGVSIFVPFGDAVIGDGAEFTIAASGGSGYVTSIDFTGSQLIVDLNPPRRQQFGGQGNFNGLVFAFDPNITITSATVSSTTNFLLEDSGGFPFGDDRLDFGAGFLTVNLEILFFDPNASFTIDYTTDAISQPVPVPAAALLFAPVAAAGFLRRRKKA